MSRQQIFFKAKHILQLIFLLYFPLKLCLMSILPIRIQNVNLLSDGCIVLVQGWHLKRISYSMVLILVCNLASFLRFSCAVAVACFLTTLSMHICSTQLETGKYCTGRTIYSLHSSKCSRVKIKVDYGTEFILGQFII